MIQPIRTFASDNFSGVDPAVMRYLQDINTQGHTPSYGADSVTEEARLLFRKFFGNDTQTLFVPTGTGANILSLKLLLQKPYEAVVCSEVSHVFEEETGALSMSTGAHIFTIAHYDGKITLKDLARDVELRGSLGFHSSVPKVVSIASTTEYGTYYLPSEIKAIADYCHQHDMYVHLDGCRLPNAIAAAECDLASYVRDTGVDVLSFGGAKNGLMNAEAVVIFRAPESDLLRMQKQAMQLTSKMRYCAGQFIPYLTNDLWLKNARHSNMLAQKLADGLRAKLGKHITFTRPVATNQVFCTMPAEVTAALRKAGHEFYDWNSPSEVRLVTSWDNTTADVEEFLDLM